MAESGRVPRKGRIHASIEKLTGQVPKNGIISVSTAKWNNPDEHSEKVEEYRKTFKTSTEKLKNPGEYREKVESVRVLKNCPDEYRKMVESV